MVQGGTGRQRKNHVYVGTFLISIQNNNFGQSYGLIEAVVNFSLQILSSLISVARTNLAPSRAATLLQDSSNPSSYNLTATLLSLCAIVEDLLVKEGGCECYSKYIN